MIRVHFQPSSDLFNQSSLAHSIRTYWKHDASTLEQKLKTSDTHVLSELKLLGRRTGLDGMGWISGWGNTPTGV